MDGLNVKVERIWTGEMWMEFEMMKKGRTSLSRSLFKLCSYVCEIFQILNTYDVKVHGYFKDIFQ